MGRYGVLSSQNMSHDYTIYKRQNERFGNVNYSSFRQSKRCKFMPKMHQNMFGGPPGGSYCAPPNPLAAMGLLLRAVRGGKGGEWNEREGIGMGREAKGWGGGGQGRRPYHLHF